MSFGRLFMSIPVISAISSTLFADILDIDEVNMLLYLLLSVFFAIVIKSSALTPLGCGNTSFGCTGTTSAALLKIYLCPDGSLNVILA